MLYRLIRLINPLKIPGRKIFIWLLPMLLQKKLSANTILHDYVKMRSLQVLERVQSIEYFVLNNFQHITADTSKSKT